MAGEGTAFAVEGVAEDRAAEVAEVDPDLVGATGAGFALDEGAAVGAGKDAVVGGGVAAVAGFGNVHLLPVDAVAGDGGIDRAGAVAGRAANEGEVGFFDLAVGELFGEGAVREIVFSNDEAAAGFLVEAVDDAGTFHAADLREMAAVVKEGGNKGAVGVARAGVDDHAGRFVQDDESFVFKKDVEGDVFGLRGGAGFYVGFLPENRVAGADGFGGFGRGAIVLHASIADDGLNVGTRVFGQSGREVAVKTLFRRILFNEEALLNGHDGNFFAAE
jgi:hypothetical protein